METTRDAARACDETLGAEDGAAADFALEWAMPASGLRDDEAGMALAVPGEFGRDDDIARPVVLRFARTIRPAISRLPPPEGKMHCYLMASGALAILSGTECLLNVY
jgi:hypothetical protein